MSNKTIKISENEIENCNGNLISLKNSWNSIPPIKNRMKKSIGYASNQVRECSDTATQASKGISILFENSIRFFKATGISFDENDKANAKAIEQ